MESLTWLCLSLGREDSLFIYLSIYFDLKIFLFYLFIFGCVGSSLLHAGFLLLWRAETPLRCGARASHCCGFSCGARALGARTSEVVASGL